MTSDSVNMNAVSIDFEIDPLRQNITIIGCRYSTADERSFGYKGIYLPVKGERLDQTKDSFAKEGVDPK